MWTRSRRIRARSLGLAGMSWVMVLLLIVVAAPVAVADDAGSGETTAQDNVVVPEPATLIFASAAGMALFRRRFARALR